MGVGSLHERSVLSAASYEARKFGVRSAMPVRQALKLCPQLQVVSGSRHRYKEVSHKVMEVLSNYSPVVEQASIDEAYIDITGTEKLFGPPLQIAKSIKADIRKTTGLTASVGIAPVKFLAKIASDLNKPDGISIITADQGSGIPQNPASRKDPRRRQKGPAPLTLLRHHLCRRPAPLSPGILERAFWGTGTCPLRQRCGHRPHPGHRRRTHEIIQR